MRFFLSFALLLTLPLLAADARYYQIIRSAVLRSERDVLAELTQYCEQKAHECESQRTALEPQLVKLTPDQKAKALNEIAGLSQQASTWRSILLPVGRDAVTTYYRQQVGHRESIEKTVAFVKAQTAPISVGLARAQEHVIRTAIKDEEFTSWKAIEGMRDFLHQNTPGADFVLANPKSEPSGETSATEVGQRLVGDAAELMLKLLASSQRKALRLWNTGTPFKQ